MKHLVKRFRNEIRDRDDIGPNRVVVLTDDPLRVNNVLAAELLLKSVFKGRVQVIRGSDGVLVGSREEAASLRLQSFTDDIDVKEDLLLSSLLVSEIETFLKDKTSENLKVFVPDTAEVRLIETLGDRWEDVRYGL